MRCGRSGRVWSPGATTGRPRRWSVMGSGRSGQRLSAEPMLGRPQRRGATGCGRSGRALTSGRMPTETTGGARAPTGTGSGPSERAWKQTVPSGTGAAPAAAHLGTAHLGAATATARRRRQIGRACVTETSRLIARGCCTETARLIGRAGFSRTARKICRAGCRGTTGRAVPRWLPSEAATAATRSRQSATVPGLLGRETAPFPVIGTWTGSRRQYRTTAMTTR